MSRIVPDLATPYHVLVRFGRWEEALAEPAPDADFKVTTAFWRYARGLPLSSLGRVERRRASSITSSRRSTASRRAPASRETS